MAHLPMWGPDPDRAEPSSASSGLWIPADELASADAPGPESDLAELAARFSEHSGGGLSKELSADLALEIVLNEIVEQACLATGATGAAIVLERDGELVCRASAGPNAPELGVRLDTEAGLSGACVQTLQIQRCEDAQSDPRADRQASRLLGIRSVMILPLLRDNRLAGVFEVFSSRPSAFGERDERTLEALAQRALKNLQRASEPLLIPAAEAPAPAMPATVRAPLMSVPAASIPVTPPAVAPVRQNPVERIYVPEMKIRGDEPAPAYPTEEIPNGGRHLDGVTLVLAGLVFACAVLLSTLVGLHFGRQQATSRAHRDKPASTAAAASPAPTAEQGQASSSIPNPARAHGGAGGALLSSSAAGAASAVADGQKAVTQPDVRPSGTRAAAAPPAGSLQVYENGKEVFRMLPSAQGDKKNVAAGELERASALEPAPVFVLSPEAADSNLLRRVEPDYPEQARRQGIQGSVVLDLHIGKDGAVQEVTLVSGQPALVEAATLAVRQWRFKPHYDDGREVDMQTRTTLRFTLPNQ